MAAMLVPILKETGHKDGNQVERLLWKNVALKYVNLFFNLVTFCMAAMLAACHFEKVSLRRCSRSRSQNVETSVPKCENYIFFISNVSAHGGHFG